MRKRRAITLFGGFTLLLLAYFAWCVSPFFRKPRLAFSGNVPPEARAIIREWRAYKNLSSADKVFLQIMRNIAKPYTVGPFELLARSDGTGIYLEMPEFDIVASTQCRCKNGKWVLGSFSDRARF